MKTALRVLAFALACLMGMGALAEMNLPAGMVEIREEAFLNNLSIQNVTVPEGTAAIGARAFANSSATEIKLPESLTYIADDAFEGCGDDLWLIVQEGSYAHEWCRNHDVLYEVQAESGRVSDIAPANKVLSLEFVEEETEDGESLEIIRAVVSTAQACTLRVQVLDKKGEICAGYEAPLDAGLYMQSVEIDSQGLVPLFHELQAVLLDGEGNALCSTYANIVNTIAYWESASQTMEDFSAERVLDYGDAGFAVLAEDVVLLGAEARANDDASYTFASDTPLNPGEVVLISVGGVNTPVKVGSVQNHGDGTMTITEDDDVALDELYDTLRIDDDLILNPGAEDEGLLPVNQSITYDVLKGSINGGVRVHLYMNYYKDLNFFEVGIDGTYIGDVSLTLSERIDTFKDDNSPGPVFFDQLVVIPYANIPVNLKFSLPLNLKAEAGGTLDFHANVHAGLRWDTVNGDSGQWDGEITEAQPKLKGTFEFKLGPEFSVNFKLGKAVIIRAAIQAGGYGTGELGGLLYETNEPRLYRIHACAECLDVDVGYFAGVRATIKAKLSKKISYTPLDIGNDIRWNTDVFHYSIRNEDISIYGGAEALELGPCPNYKYLLDVYTRNRKNEEVSGIPVTLSGGKIETVVLDSPVEVYLYPGAYNASAEFESVTRFRDFIIEDTSYAVLLQELPTTIGGMVEKIHTDTPLSGVSVTLTLPDGTTMQDTTDDEGGFLFEYLPGGEFSLSLSKEGFKDRTMNGLSYAAGSNNYIETYLEPEDGLLPLVLVGFDQDEFGERAACTEDGLFLDYLPMVSLAVQRDEYGFVEWVALKHEACADEYSYYPEIMAGYVDMFGVNMGDGEYTYVVQLGNTGTGGGCDVLVLKLINGEWKLLKKFVYEDFTDNIYVDATFTSDYAYSGTLQPTGRRFSGVLPSDGLDRTGEHLNDRNLGYMDYELNAEDETYNLIFETSEYALGNYDSVGGSNTRYIMQDGALVIESQWYKPYYGTITHD